MDLESCLPAELRGPTTTITKIAAGLSGAGVYRVEAGEHKLVLKVGTEDEPVDDWRRRRLVQELAAGAGLAPRVVHVDEERRAIVSELVVDRSIAGLLFDPRTRASGVAMIGRTLRRVHDLPLPPELAGRTPLALLRLLWTGPLKGLEVPAFVIEAVERELASKAPATERAPVLSHNDVNPTNIIYDGERIVLLDWDTAGPNDPFYDLAAVAVFFRFDEPTCLAMLSAYDDEPVSTIPALFHYNRRLVAVLCGTAFLHLARRGGHTGGNATLATTEGLADFYQRLRTGGVNIGSPDGQWGFGLALIKSSFE